MKMYIEFIYIINFLLDFMILYGTKRLLKINKSNIRIVLSSSIGMMSTLLIYIKISSIELFIIKIIFSFIMIIVAFGFNNIFKNTIYKLADFGEAKATKFNNKINTLRGTDIYMSPILYNGLKASKEDVQHNLYKSDVFSLGYTLLYAISLNYDIINELRDLDDNEKIKKILYERLKPRFSDNFIELILRMINPDEQTRIDFIELDKLIKDLL